MALRSPPRAFPRVMRELFRSPSSALGTVLVLVFIVLAIFGPWLSPYGRTQQIAMDARQAPSLRHWFGTDLLGRDIFSRILYGARSILSLTGLGALMAVVAGTVLGLASGYWGGWFDEVVMRILDSVLAIPALLLALVLLGAVGRSQSSILAVIAVVYLPIVARVVRSEVLAVKSLGYIESARLRGEGLAYILFREILPSVLPALSVEAAVRFSYGIFLVASLGYLGVGVQPPTPDWGLMVKEARTAVRLTPWALYFPAGAIALLVIGVNLTADGLKGALQSSTRALSPRMRARIVRARRACAQEEDASLPAGEAALLSAHHLTASYRVREGWLDALRDVSFEIQPGETLGVVGESGSGKSTLALAVVQYLSANGAVRAGSLCFEGESILHRSSQALRAMRREGVALIPQDPMASLNPSLRVGKQIAEVLRQPEGTRCDVSLDVLDLVTRVHIPDAARVVRQFPHQLSGGMQQRIVIAMALAANPRLLILDEPTTGLDATTEASILDLVDALLSDGRRAALYISHDLGVVARVSDRIAVLYAGELVETGAVEDVFRTPQHPYTIGLLASIPRLSARRHSLHLPSMPGSIPPIGALPTGCVFRPRCPLSSVVCERRPDLVSAAPRREVRCHHYSRVSEMRARLFADEGAHPKRATESPRSPVLSLRDLETRFALRRSVREVIAGHPRQAVHAVNGVSMDLRPSTTVGIVGESGSGKTTLARSILGLTPRTGGDVRLEDAILPAAVAGRSREMLRDIQAVSQNPDQALNPYLPVGVSLGRQLVRLTGVAREDQGDEIERALADVGLDSAYATRVPDQLSGGEKQRVAIARATISRSKVVVCDEATSSLDVSVQARILNLLADLQIRSEGAYILISHDLAVVAHLSDVIAVMYLGAMMESGPRHAVLLPPYHPYTEALLSSVPAMDTVNRQARIRLTGGVPSPVDLPAGCPFESRCPRRLGEICRVQSPPQRQGEQGHRIACHIPLQELRDVQMALADQMIDEGGIQP